MSFINVQLNGNIKHSDKRTVKNTNLQDSIENKNAEFAVWSIHVNSVGVTLTGLIIVMVLFLIFKHVNMQCLKRIWRKMCNCSNPASRTRPVVNSQADDPVTVIPRCARVPIVPRMEQPRALYPELYSNFYRNMQEQPAYQRYTTASKGTATCLM